MSSGERKTIKTEPVPEYQSFEKASTDTAAPNKQQEERVSTKIPNTDPSTDALPIKEEKHYVKLKTALPGQKESVAETERWKKIEALRAYYADLDKQEKAMTRDDPEYDEVKQEMDRVKLTLAKLLLGKK